jgi:hypothetical protein
LPSSRTLRLPRHASRVRVPRALRPRGDSSVFRRFQTFQGDSHSETRVALPCFQLLNGVRLSITAGGG